MSNMKAYLANTIDGKLLVLSIWGCHLLVVVDPKSVMMWASLRQDDLFRQRDDHSRVEAELQLEKGRLRELQEQLGLLKAEYEEKFQTLDSEKAWNEIDIPWIDTSWVIDTQWVIDWRGAIKD